MIEGYRLSPHQTRLWSLQQNSRAYRVQMAILIDGPLKADVLKRSLEAMLARHEILRATFHRQPGMEMPLQMISGHCNLAWSEHDLSHLTIERQAKRCAEMFQPESFHPFDFERGPVLQAILFARSQSKHVLVVSLPALCADLWTARNLFKEVGRAYAGLSGDDPGAEPAPYTQFAEWQHELLEEEEAEEGKRFWRSYELGSFSKVGMPFEMRPAAGNGFAPRSIVFDVGTELSSRIDALATRHKTSASAALLACWQSLWWRLTGGADVVVGALSPGRKYEELRPAFGLFAKYLPSRTHIEDRSRFTEVIGRVIESQRDAVAREEYFVWDADQERPGAPRENLFFPIAFDFDEEPASYTAGGLSFSLSQEYNCIDRFKLKLSAVRRNHSLSTALHYDPNYIQSDCVAVLARYFKTFLESAAKSPDAYISELEILSEADRRRLLVEFNSTSAPYPKDKCIHQLFRERVDRCPDSIAAIFEDRQLTYADLNRRSNQVAHHLISRGAYTGAIIGLCLERSLEMLVGLLGILKAGASYLPLDSELPKSRIEYQIAEARCPILITQENLLSRLPDFEGKIERLDRDWAQFDNLPVDDPTSLPPSQAPAYVIYTSGSTGQPKGVAISHRSLVNYVHAVGDRFELWGETAGRQLSFATVSTIAADLGNTAIFPSLLTGGRLHIVSYETATNGGSFARYLSERSIEALKIVPSHLSGLTVEGPHALPARHLIFGGETLSYEFASHIADSHSSCRVVNHYGPTETTIGSLTYSFSENRRAPRMGASVPIGRPLANTEVYLLDGRLNPAPLGVAGEIYIGGAGVASYYLNKPEQTAERFVPNPYSPGERLYKTGDLARYLPGGDVEFLGRADNQVKIHGYRIELGEIESALNRHPAVKESAVVAREDENGRKRLIAYVVPNQAPATLDRELTSFLRLHLPAYMAPSAIITLKAMPLTPNGKLDRHRLPDPQRSNRESVLAAPRTPAERILTEIWKEALRVEQVGIHDNFFELGGDSILSLQIVAKANRAGLRLTHKQLFEHPTIADLASVMGEESTIEIEQGAVTGSVPLTPIQRWFFERNLQAPHHWNMGIMLEVQPPYDAGAMEKAVRHLVEYHDALRLRFLPSGTAWRQINTAPGAENYFSVIDLSGAPAGLRQRAIEQCGEQLQTSLNLSDGPLLRVSLIDRGPGLSGRLIIVLHHLVVDGVSWRVLLSDLQTAYEQISGGETVRLPPKTTSFKQWAESLSEYAQSEALRKEMAYWLSETRAASLGLSPDHHDGVALNIESSARGVVSSLTRDETRALLQEVPGAYHTQINDVLLTALVQAFARTTGERSLLVELEGHGREPIIEGVDVSRTVGWFTTHFPVRLDLSWASTVGDGLKLIKEQIRRIPNHGIGYGLLRFLCEDANISEDMAALPRPQISFNYLGQFDELLDSPKFKPARESLGPDRSPEGIRSHLLKVNASVIDGCFEANWGYSHHVYDRLTIERLAQNFGEALRAIITHCQAPEAGGYTPSDFSEPGLSQYEVDLALAAISPTDDTPNMRRGGMLEDMYSLSPLQEGMLFHSLSAPGSDVYLRQMSFAICGNLNVWAFEHAWRQVVDRHTALRTSFFWEGIDRLLQVVHKSVALKFERLDWRGLGPSEQTVRIEEYCRAQRAEGFDLSRPPLMRIALVRTGEDSYQFVWSYHHLIMDAWSRATIYKEVIELYQAYDSGRELHLEPSRPYGDYITWLRKQDRSKAETFWKRILTGFNSPTRLGPSSNRGGKSDHEAGMAAEEVRIPATGASQLRAFSQQQGLTLNTLIQGAWALILSCYSGERDVAFGTVVSGRPAGMKCVESIVGAFINTLVMRVQVPAGARLAPWLKEIQLLQAEMSQYEFSRLVDLQRWSDLPNGSPLFESVLSFANHPVAASADSLGRSLEITGVRFGEDSHYPLGIEVAPGPELALRVIYDSRRFEAGFIREMLARMVALLQSFVSNPERRLGALMFFGDDEDARADENSESQDLLDIDAQFTF